MKEKILLLTALSLCIVVELRADPEEKSIESSPPNPAIEARNAAYDKYNESKQKIQDAYRMQLSEAVILADEMRLYLLNHKPVKEFPEGERSDYFPIKPYQSYSRILNKKTLNEQDGSVCCKLFAELLRGDDEVSPFCHLPAHGIAFYRDGELILETSICWHCGNYFVEYPDDFMSASWIGFSGQEASKKLKDLLTKHMPLEKNEIEDAEQAGADQPATALELKSEGSDKPQPESKVAPR